MATICSKRGERRQTMIKVASDLAAHCSLTAYFMASTFEWRILHVLFSRSP
ncbi:Hypothetical protein FKW44_010523 [Caligus rogercresseyi]|uniref:Uncharacterized protein n=1 Tax=Caligus rogercresseyi TaxID=217165 RepID=A0A7T8HGW9_CALRO|nr:Hypothetical protein FKW44_010523 [Caligus rogercresseyi]